MVAEAGGLVKARAANRDAPALNRAEPACRESIVVSWRTNALGTAREHMAIDYRVASWGRAR